MQGNSNITISIALDHISKYNTQKQLKKITKCLV